MATHSTEERMGHLRTTIELQPGEKISLCRCFKSKTFPYCDGEHKHEANQCGPVIVQVPAPAEQK